MMVVMKSKLVHVCLEILQELTMNNDLTIMWIPGHEGVAGNETADALARKGSEEKFIGSEHFCGYQICHFKEKQGKVLSLPDRSQSRILIKYSTKRTKEFLELSRLEMKKITGLITVHCSLKGYLKKIGKADSV